MTVTAHTTSTKPAVFTSAVATAANPPAVGVLANAGLVAVGAPSVVDPSNVLTVGVGKEFATIGAAVAAATNGTTILVDAGTYTNDFATITSKVTLIGVGGMVNMVATIPPSNLKGIITVDNDATIKNFSFSGAAISDADGGNGAGIRYEGGQMVLQNDSFSYNQNGIMGSPVMGLAVNTVNINNCLFSSNGSGSGYTHNLYIGAVDSLTATNSVFEYANVGHEFKSRALVNNISGNVFRDGPTGTASYSIDLPDGGNDTITNNYIEKGPMAQNNAIVHFGGEGIPYAGSQLTVSGNLFQNDRGSSAVGLLNQTVISANVSGNEFSGFDGATLVQGPATETGNIDGNGVALPDSTLVGVLPGNTMIITDALAHTVTLTDSLQAVQGGAGLLTVYAQTGHVDAIGGSGGMVFSEAPTSGGNSISTLAGSTNTITVVGQDLIDSEGTDRIIGGAGNLTVQVGGTATIDDGTGNNLWNVVGTAYITGHGGNPVVSVGPQASATIGGTVGYLHLSNNGGNASINVVQNGSSEVLSITGGAVNTVIYGAVMNISTAGGAIGTTLRIGAGTATVTSAGPDTVWAGSGADTVIITGSAAVHAGTGTLAVFGRGSPGATVFGNGGTTSIDGDTGHITYYGGAKANTLQLILGNNTIDGGAGRLTINGGSREIFTGGTGGLTYTATDGGGADAISTAVGSSNTLTLGAADTVDSWGTDTIVGGTGNQSINVHGNSTITGSTGNSSLTFWGRDTLVGVGQDNCLVQAGASLTVTAGTLTQVSETGAVANFWASAGGAHAIVTSGSATVANNSDGSINVITAAGTSTRVVLGGGVIGVNSAGSDVIQAGSGSDTIAITAANTQILGGAGALAIHNYDWNAGDTVTVRGGAGSLSYDQGPGHLVFIGGTGAATINAAYGSVDATGGAGQLTLQGGSAGTHFVAGSGTAGLALTSAGAAITFGSGTTAVQEASYGTPDVYTFAAGHGGGSDFIAGFKVGVDQLVYQGVGFVSQTVTTGGTTMTLTDGTQLTLAGIFDTSSLRSSSSLVHSTVSTSHGH